MSARASSVGALLRSMTVHPVDGRLLLQHVLDVHHAGLIAHPERVLSEAEADRYASLVERRARGEPIAYLLGEREFYGRRFRVDPAVLIPRPESELLVDLALDRIASTAKASLLDLGTGSGNIAITLALERPHIDVVSVDTSAAALERAMANARALGARNVAFLHGDWFGPVTGERFDLIVSNPPYVALGDPHLEQGDVRFEPRSALEAGPDGLDSIRRIVTEAAHHLRPGGWLLFEHGYDQGEASADLLDAAGFVDLVRAQDLAGTPRVSGGRVR